MYFLMVSWFNCELEFRVDCPVPRLGSHEVCIRSERRVDHLNKVLERSRNTASSILASSFV